LSFTAPASIAGAGMVDDADVVLFTATSLGEATGGTFSLYFDSSDVGLSSSSEVIDTVHQLDDGRLVVSTTGSVSVNGAAGAAADLLVFQPLSLGPGTSGSWAMYFDASDVGLSTTNENIDAASVDAAGNIYLSTTGSFSVSGLSGADEDVFVFSPASLGGSTSGSFVTSLLFDGSTFGLSSNDVTGVGLPDVPAGAVSFADRVDWRFVPGPAFSRGDSIEPRRGDISTGRHSEALAARDSVIESAYPERPNAVETRSARAARRPVADFHTANRLVEAELLAIDLAFSEVL
jgi:hypothetical protein